jgi:hypothetical protein
MPQETYVSRTSRLLRDFDRSAARIKRGLTARQGEAQATVLLRASREEYAALIPRIPYIGETNPLLVFLLPTSRYLAVYRAYQRAGRTVEEAGRTVYEMGAAEFAALPGLVRRAIRYLWFSPWFENRLQTRALESQMRTYPGGYVLNYVEGDGQSFDYGVDYTECASCKFLTAEGALELAPYVCSVDKVASEMLSWGLVRTTTLAEGGERCDFRFKRGGQTSVASSVMVWPQD